MSGVFLGLGLLLGVGGSGINRALVDFYCNAVGNAHNDISSGNFLDFSIDTTGGNNGVAFLETFAEFLDLLLLFLLGTNHHEIEDGDKQHNHDDARPSAATLNGSLEGDKL